MQRNMPGRAWVFQMLLVFGGSTTNVIDGSHHWYLRAAVRCLVTGQ